jgi:cytochrome c556
MKIRSLFTSTVLALALGPVAFSQGGPGGAPGGAPAAPKTPLEEIMAKNSTASRGMSPGRGGIADLADPAKRAEALNQVAIIKAGANEAIKLSPKWTPPTITAEADKAAYVADFQATMKKFLAAIEALEAGLKANASIEQLTPLYQALGAVQMEAHPKFRAPRGGRGGPGGGGGGGGAPRGGQ